MNSRQETLAGYLFIGPALLFFVVLVAFPFFFSLFLAFTKWNFLSGLKGIEMVGFANFKNAFQDRSFIAAIKNTFYYAGVTVPVSIVIALGLAGLMNGKVYGSKILRLAFIIPYISSTVALGAVFKCLFKDTGVINTLLKAFFNLAKTPSWLGDDALTKIPICLLVIWTAIGYEFIIYMAALQNVPSTLYEAADIDGASGFKKFMSITVPLISPTTFYLVIIRLIAVFKIFSSVNIMSLGSSSTSNTSIVAEIYNSGFSSYKFGYAGAQALVLFLIILTVTLINFWGQKKWIYY